MSDKGELSRSAGFSKLFLQLSKSGARKKLNESVYGTDLDQFNMLDSEQLEKLVLESHLSEGKSFADLGCGLGEITRFVSESSGANGLGVDFAKEMIETLVASERVNYQWGDLNDLQLEGEFDSIISVDSLYFVDNLESTLNRTLSLLKKGGRLLAFFTQTPKRTPYMGPSAKDSYLGQTLTQMGIDFSATDFTKNGREVWRKMDLALTALKEEFVAEGNEEPFWQQRAEVDQMLDWIKKDEHSRHLYVIQKDVS